MRLLKILAAIVVVIAVSIVSGISGYPLLKEARSHGPFSVTITTPDGRSLKGMVVTVYAKEPMLMHGDRAVYMEDRLADTDKPVTFPRRFIHWFDKPQMIVAVTHPLVSGKSSYRSGGPVDRDGEIDLGTITVDYMEDRLQRKMDELKPGIAAGRWRESLMSDILGGWMHGHALNLIREYKSVSMDLSPAQRESLLSAVDELEGIASVTPARDQESNVWQVRRLRDLLVDNKL